MKLVLEVLDQQSKGIVSEDVGSSRRTLEAVIQALVSLEHYYLKVQFHEFLSFSESILHLLYVSLISVKPGEKTFYDYVLTVKKQRYLLNTNISNILADNGKLVRILNFACKNHFVLSMLSLAFEHLEMEGETDLVLKINYYPIKSKFYVSIAVDN